MKFKMLLTVVGLALGSSAYAADCGNMVGADSENAKVALGWLDMAFNQHKMAEAFDKYISRDNYMNHSVYGASTKQKQTFEEQKAAEIKAVPDGARFEFKQVMVQGELVMVHIHAFANPPKAEKWGDEIIEILRVKNGKIVDHWDIHAPLKEDSTVFLGLDRHCTK